MVMLVNAPIRGNDKQGAGYYGAPRSGGRKHKGVDISCYKNTEVLSISEGKVTKIGYPYDPNDSKKGHLRYVQISYGDYDFRYFYIHPAVSIGDRVIKGDTLGITQGLIDIYPGITDHYHFEVKENGKIINPKEFLT